VRLAVTPGLPFLKQLVVIGAFAEHSRPALWALLVLAGYASFMRDLPTALRANAKAPGPHLVTPLLRHGLMISA